ncbi:MAG: hypothetical protein DRH26_04305 [Deltaproteobacteria bacterium]|nr:MAG: hypothetical protein DRH26_04305 [Deltaproteobacteria bacterium]
MNHKNLSIAVVGTTSSGKSSFINALCGRYILPVGVQETTRYVTELIHIPTNIITSIENKAISFEKKYFSTDSEARKYIYDLIEKFQNSSNQFHKITRNRVQISFISDFLNIFSHRINNYNKIQEEEQVSLKIIDLPGYNYDGDDRNWEMIHNCIENAVIIFIFNAEETDSVKEDELLRNLLEHQHKKKFYQDIFFVLNRCDALFRDCPDQSAFQAKLKSLRDRISKVVKDIFAKEIHTTSIPKIHPLSALPVMYGEILYWNYKNLSDEEKSELLSRASLFSNQMLSEDICDLLPRSIKKWKFHHIRLYRNEIIKSSFYNSFLFSFEAHVKSLFAFNWLSWSDPIHHRDWHD